MCVILISQYILVTKSRHLCVVISFLFLLIMLMATHLDPTVENYYNMGIMIKTKDRKSKEGINALFQSSAKKVFQKYVSANTINY